MKFILAFCTIATIVLLVMHRMDQRYAEGVAHGVKTALHLPPSEALEVTCASLWIGEQAKKAQKQ
jgi:hypothetical protein